MIRNLLPTVWRRSETPLRRAEESPFLALHREMNRMFDDFSRGFDLSPFDGGWSWGFSPPVDVREDEKEVTVKAELPGMEEKDIEVNLADNGLTIKGEKKAEKEEKGKDNWYRETSYGAFHRFIPLPEGLDKEKVDARFKNGVLTVTLRRLEEAKGKKIAIKAE
ncbi:Hsp20/alpha crystallin family protein [Syntrophus aciditrophicus]|mgnify:FL=1|uniref:Small heat shock protein n=1 Tax=Syntrophus aciditrophicus (strain SB) TaxID=56780 RepID=Q2LU35_SYNAS|nr:Hsp20/alpha crystallin family protein [Syntrophus aciditrophicus]ABC77598.1 small heat shock protein [Syntrophus aciditrophicus SB]